MMVNVITPPTTTTSICKHGPVLKPERKHWKALQRLAIKSSVYANRWKAAFL